jgi:hypothetical protein
MDAAVEEERMIVGLCLVEEETHCGGSLGVVESQMIEVMLYGVS